jgi:cell division protein YceG involved in septum cleavage
MEVVHHCETNFSPGSYNMNRDINMQNIRPRISQARTQHKPDIKKFIRLGQRIRQDLKRISHFYSSSFITKQRYVMKVSQEGNNKGGLTEVQSLALVLSSGHKKTILGASLSFHKIVPV